MFRTSAITLATALTRALPAAMRRSTVPILSMARLRVEAGVLTVTTTDLSNQIDVEAIVEAVGPSGAIAANPRHLLAILRLIPRMDAVEIVRDGDAHSIVMTWNGGRARLAVLPAEDMPDMAVGDPMYWATLGAEANDALARVSPFVSNNETRYYLNGVALAHRDGRGLFVATDGHRMGIMPGGDAMAELTKHFQSEKMPIIPRETVKVWLSMAQRGDIDLWFHSPLYVQIKSDGMRLWSKLIDGTFPDFSRVLPVLSKLDAITTSRGSVLRALGLAKSVAGRNGNGWVIIKDRRAQIGATLTDIGDIAADIGPVDSDNFTFPVNLKYLWEAVQATRGKFVTIHAQGQNGATAIMSPISVAGSDAKPGEHVLVMPTRPIEYPRLSAPVLEEAA